MISEVSFKKNPVVRGATWRLKVRYLQSDGETPVDLTGCTARVRVRLDRESDLVWDSEIDVETGEILTELTPAETERLFFRSERIFLEVVFPSETRPILTGLLETQ